VNIIALTEEYYPNNYTSVSTYKDLRLKEISACMAELTEQINCVSKVIGEHKPVSSLLFKDTEFLTADDKMRIYKDWRRFIANGYAKSCFTDRLYKHLSLHCGYIAHYNRSGFYHTYWQNSINEYAKNNNLLVRPVPPAFYNFFSFIVQFDVDYRDYRDINTLMLYDLRSQLTALKKELENEVFSLFQSDINNKSHLAIEKKAYLDNRIEDLASELERLKRELDNLNPETFIESHAEKYKALFPDMDEETFMLKGSVGNLL